MAAKKIFEIYKEFIDLIKDLRNQLHPEFQRRLAEVSDTFITARGLEIDESSVECQEHGISSVELKRVIFELFIQVYDEVESKKLMELAELGNLWEIVEDLNASIKHSNAIAKPSSQSCGPVALGSKDPKEPKFRE